MASAKKRRSAPETKRKSRGSKQPAATPRVVSWISELLAVLLVGIAGFILFSVLSHSIKVNQTEETSTAYNIMGPAGHFTATVLKGLLGYSSLTISFWIFVISIGTWIVANNPDRRLIMSKTMFFIGALLSTLFLGAIAAGIWLRIGGGLVGDSIFDLLARNFGLLGAYFILSVAVAFSMALAFQQSTVSLIGGIFKALYAVLKFAWEVFTRVFAKLWNGFNDAIQGSDYNRTYSKELGDDLPKPRIRKNKIIEPEEEQEDEVTHIVVERRARSKEKLSKKSIRQFKDYKLPELDLLSPGETVATVEDDEALRKKSKLIEDKLKDFGVIGRVTHVHPGPVITLFEFEPAPGVKVGKVASLQDDLAMSLKATAIRIIAPIPKRGTVGIEVPNVNREIVRLRDVLESPDFVKAESFLSLALGKDVYGVPVVVDIASMPHLLMAGSTGTGKSVSINTILLSLLYRATPEELGLILIDPKILELSVYEGIPHLKVPVVTVPKQAKAVLAWAVNEMERRYKLMQAYGVRNIDGYNRIAKGEDTADEDLEVESDADLAALPQEELKQLPEILIVVDELADLMLSVGRDIEELIARLAQKARAAGIHLLLATQRPSVDVITGLIKANFPARLSFRVSSRIDSRTILDSMGAEKLLGRGDLLLMMPGDHHLRRVHGAYVSDQEVIDVVAAIKNQASPNYDTEIISACEKALKEDEGSDSEKGEVEYDALYDESVQLVIDKGVASTSMLQRAFRIGYNRAARMIDTMEREGVIGPLDGAKPREVLISSSEELS